MTVPEKSPPASQARRIASGNGDAPKDISMAYAGMGPEVVHRSEGPSSRIIGALMGICGEFVVLRQGGGGECRDCERKVCDVFRSRLRLMMPSVIEAGHSLVVVGPGFSALLY